MISLGQAGLRVDRKEGRLADGNAMQGLFDRQVRPVHLRPCASVLSGVFF